MKLFISTELTRMPQNRQILLSIYVFLISHVDKNVQGELNVTHELLLPILKSSKGCKFFLTKTHFVSLTPTNILPISCWVELIKLQDKGKVEVPFKVLLLQLMRKR